MSVIELNTQVEQLALPEAMHHFFMYFQNAPNKEKIVIGLTATKHVTFHLGTKSKVFDVHFTDETFPEGHASRSRTLMSIPYETAEKLAIYLERIFPPILTYCFASQRINLGRLHHHNCVLAQMDNAETKLEGWLKVSKKKMKLGKSISKEKLLSLYYWPKELPNERPANQYSVYKVKRGRLLYQGFIWYPPNAQGRKPFFVTRKRFYELGLIVKSEVFNKCLELDVYFNTDLWNELTDRDAGNTTF